MTYMYSQGPKVFPQKCFAVDFSAFTCLQENLILEFSQAKQKQITVVQKLNE